MDGAGRAVKPPGPGRHRPAAVAGSRGLHYLADWQVALRSFAGVLRPGGWLVASLDHPFAPPLPGQQGSYFDTELVADTWVKGGVEVTQRFWRRPLADAVDAFADAGFAVERVVEAQPSAEARARFPEDLDRVVGVPWFIVSGCGCPGEPAERSGRGRQPQAGDQCWSA